MKPSFALLFSQESVGLLHRTQDGWHSLGSVDFHDPDLTDSLSMLRGQAQDLAPDGFTTLLMLPNSEVLYTSLPAPDTGQEEAVIAALEGRTPYAIGELAYDWLQEDGLLRVAAVARETMDEAEAFAADYRFQPVAFSAHPEPEDFPRPPWFGLSGFASSLPATQHPDRDALPDMAALSAAALMGGDDEGGDEDLDALLMTAPAAPAPQPEPEPEPEPEPAPEPVADPVADADADPQEPPVPEPVFTGDAEPEPFVAEPDAQDDSHSLPLQDSPDTTDPASDPAVPDALPQADGAQTTAEDWQSVPQAVSPAARLLAELATRPSADHHAPATLAARLAAAAAAEAQAEAQEAAKHTAQPAATDAALPPVPAPAPVADAAALIPVTAMPTRDEPSVSEAIAAGEDAAHQTEAWPGEDEDLPAIAPAALAASLSAAPVAPARGAVSAPRGATVITAPRRAASPAPVAPVRMPDAAQKAAGPVSARSAPLPPSAARAPVKPAGSEAEAMTVYGRRNPKVGGKPRYLGLAMTGVLLILLLVLAVWSAIFMDTPTDHGAADTGNSAGILADGGDFLGESDLLSTPPETAQPAMADTPPAIDPEAEADSVLAAADLPPEAPEAAPVADDTTQIATEVPSQAPAEDPGHLAAIPTEAVRAPGFGAAAAGTPQSVDTLTLPAGDPSLAAEAAPGRPEAPTADTSDTAPTQAGALPAFGALYQFDEQGRIRPTRNGVITPDGIHLIEARPAKIPPARPTAPPPPAAPAVPDAPATGTDDAAAAATTGEAFQPDVALSRFRPRLRPETAALAVGQAEPEPAVTELAGAPTRRPAARSAAAVTAARKAEEAEKAEEARQLAETAAAAAAAASLASAQTTGSLAATPRPAVRPQTLAAVAAAATAAPPAVRAAAVATPQTSRRVPANLHEELEDDDEPEPARAAPGIPTRASVARQATLSRAMNLGDTNLIGVFGTSSRRHALVRESGGRIRKVQVGDRIDGGRVTAIGQSNLSYTKGSRALRLELPRS